MKSLLTAMSVISFAFGYIIAKWSSSSSEETRSASSIETRYDRSKSRDTHSRGKHRDSALLDSLLGGRSISEIPAADLAAVIINLWENDNTDRFTSAKQIYQFQLLLAKLSATKLADIVTALSANPEMEKSYRLMQQIVSTLARKDPAFAMDWIAKQEDSSYYYRYVISTIAESDPLTAAALFNTAVTDGKIDESNQLSTVFESGRAVAKMGAQSFFSYWDSMPKKFQIGVISQSLENIPENDRIMFLELFHQRIQDGKLSEYNEYWDDLLSETIKRNKAAATEWLGKLPENEEKNNFRINAAGSLYVSGDKESAFKYMKEAFAASPGKEKEIINKAIEYLIYDNPEGIPAFANLLPEGRKLSAEDIHYPRHYEYEKLTVLATAFSDPNEKSIFIANSLKKISQPTDGGAPPIDSNVLDILSRRIAAMGFTGQNAARVNQAIEAVKKQLSLKN